MSTAFQTRAAPIFQFNRHREDIQREVTRRVVHELASFGGLKAPRSYQLVLNDAAFHEIRRLEKTPGASADRLAKWNSLARRLGRMDASALEGELEDLARFYVSDVVGNFDPRVYRFASRMLPVGLKMLFNTSDRISGLASMRDLSERIRVEGHTEQARALMERGTLVIVPTHSSNLDSIVLGWSLVEAGLPPATYGAGKNLFSNPLISFFMRNLGAYRVDRRLRHGLYKQILKTYSQVLLERGFHSLFFPGGTRSRSNEVEQHLKLGLMGTALTAFQARVSRGDARPIYIVPVTINYPLVLEAETLIEDHLKEKGQARYIIEDDEFSKISKVTQYAIKVMALNTNMVIRYGVPLDVFGNPVAPDGTSRGPDGSVIDPRRYLYRDGHPVIDPARDREYTRMLGTAVGEAFLRETVVLPSHCVAWLLMTRERRASPSLDLFALLRTTSGDGHSMSDIYADAERLKSTLLALEAEGRLTVDAFIKNQPTEAIVDEGVRTFGMYHTRAVVERQGELLVVNAPKLLHYYANRLSHWHEALCRGVFEEGVR
ncbi:MAG: 1-acyl-sn-glycerol-3-phosphate acyltransferase [Bradymonadia bacterium]